MNIDPPKLSPRLRAVADMVPKCETLADVGCDHGYLPVYLVLTGKAERAVASDVNPGPLSRARRTVAGYGLGGKIDLILSDGLEKLPRDEIDAVVIAGMGGELIAEILKKDLQRGAGCSHFLTARHAPPQVVIQPQTRADALRRFLAENGWMIADEDLALEGRKLYNIFSVKRGVEIIENEIYYYIGKRLIEKNHPLLGELLKRETAKWETKAAGLRTGGRAAELAKAEEILRATKTLFRKEGAPAGGGCFDN